MSKCVNKVTLIGYLGRDPEYIQTPFMKNFVLLNVATSEAWHDKKTGEKKENINWHKVVLFNSHAEIAKKHLKKGDKVYIEGKIKTHIQESDSKKIIFTEIHASDLQILESKDKNKVEMIVDDRKKNNKKEIL